MEKTNNYIAWINVAKAIGIISVVLDHLFLADSVFRRILNIFTVPFFFFISGINYHSEPSLKDFFLKKLKRLYLPYLTVGLISICVYLGLSSFLNLGITLNTQSILNCFYGLIYANASVGDMMWNRPLWFLPALFVASNLYNITAKVKNLPLRTIIVLCLTGLGMYFSFFQYHLPFQCETALSMLIWYFLGDVTKPIFIDKENDVSVAIKTLSLILCGVLGIFLGLLNGRIEVMIDYYGNSWALYYISALLVILSMVLLSQLIPDVSVIRWIGQNTLFILLWSKFPTEFFQIVPPLEQALVSENLFIQLIALIGLAALVIFFVWLFQWILKKLKLYSHVRKFIS